MTVKLADIKSASSQLLADAKTAVTILGVVLAAATEILPVVPAQWQHWVVGFITVGTVVARDVTDALSSAA